MRAILIQTILQRIKNRRRDFLGPQIDTEEGRRKDRKNGTLAANTGDLVGWKDCLASL